ncbi:GNAT family N-acetyltransferase [Tissierella sp. MB52-C2]|uniref:GNAT family N-acetyltransferase n=1 Tax=Tissierella sp. MB52-C2 TaxID=3070999 RepID=UPI00280BE447|nr:GNAT family N-acetyltransferase [Tissierella sp. MB52-C2]WMM23909.1 GNAT family N-acetyltransferase [Tissierella sp. MB52-C2]
MESLDITIERITKSNYHMFDDMVYWRTNGFERTEDEKDKNKDITFRDAFSELDYQGFYVFAALYEGRFVGWIMLIYIPKIGKWNRGIIFVEELWTAPEFRRKGIAMKLMEKAFEVQNETGAIKVRLYTDNMPAQKLYEKCGLRVTNEAVFMESNHN